MEQRRPIPAAQNRLVRFFSPFHFPTGKLRLSVADPGEPVETGMDLEPRRPFPGNIPRIREKAGPSRPPAPPLRPASGGAAATFVGVFERPWVRRGPVPVSGRGAYRPFGPLSGLTAGYGRGTRTRGTAGPAVGHHHGPARQIRPRSGGYRPPRSPVCRALPVGSRDDGPRQHPAVTRRRTDRRRRPDPLFGSPNRPNSGRQRRRLPRLPDRRRPLGRYRAPPPDRTRPAHGRRL